MGRIEEGMGSADSLRDTLGCISENQRLVMSLEEEVVVKVISGTQVS